MGGGQALRLPYDRSFRKLAARLFAGWWVVGGVLSARGWGVGAGWGVGGGVGGGGLGDVGGWARANAL